MDQHPRARGRSRGPRNNPGNSQQGDRAHGRLEMRPGPPISHSGGGEPMLVTSSRGVDHRRTVNSGRDLTQQMEGMSIRRPSSQQLMLRGARDLDQGLFAPNTKPANIQSTRGSLGNPVNLVANFFRIKMDQKWVLYQYRVDFDPEVDFHGARKGMMKEHQQKLGCIYIFEGTMLFTPLKMQNKVTELQSRRRTDDSVVTIKLTLTNELQPDNPISLQLYNLIFRQAMGQFGMVQVGRNYYNPQSKVIVDCQRVIMELWPGFISHIFRYEHGLLLCSEISHKVMRNESVLKVIKDMGGSDLRRIGRAAVERVEKFLVGQIVLTRYNNKTYRIDGINWDLKVTQTFEKGGQALSYQDYYQQQYAIKITDPYQPLLVSRPKRREIRRSGIQEIHLVPELCNVTGLTDELRSDFNVMKKLGSQTKQNPTERSRNLTSFVKKLLGHAPSREKLAEWGLDIDQRLIDFSARCLNYQDIMFGGNQMLSAGPKASWEGKFRRCKMIRSVNLDTWLLLFPRDSTNMVQDFLNEFIAVARNMGMDVQRPALQSLPDERIDAAKSCIKQFMTRSPNAQLIFCVLKHNRKDRYDSLKKLCCVDTPIPSQMMLLKTIQSPHRRQNVAMKIAVQINCKLGGEAWGVKIPLKKCMIIGIDTYHDSIQKGRSVGGFVASINGDFTRWYSNVAFQQPGVELIDGLKRCMTGAMQKYRQVNGHLPNRIMVYRDGVGDGQLEMIVEHEIPQIQSCFEIRDQPDYKPLLTFTVVKKRINARFFQKLEGGRLENPSPGTVVDTVVTRPTWYDFFVVSQSVNQGTVTPTSYNVVYDDSGLRPDHQQQLAYKLCHLYYNWQGTIRVPAPCMYAHKLAFLIGQSIHVNVSASRLQDKLYFL